MRESLFKPYADVCQILMKQCKKTLASEHPGGDVEDTEAFERGMSIPKYREFASDVYFKAFHLLRKVFKDQG